MRYFSRKSSSFIAAGVELREAKSRRHSWILRQTTLTSDERPLYFFDFPPEVLFFSYGTMPRVTSPIFQTHDARTHTHTRPYHHHHRFYSRTIAYTKTRKRGRATILETLVFNIGRSFEVLVSSRYFAQTQPRCVFRVHFRLDELLQSSQLSSAYYSPLKKFEKRRGKERASFADRPCRQQVDPGSKRSRDSSAINIYKAGGTETS